MEGSLVNVLLWQKPIKSALALTTLNVTFWLLTGQRPLFILSICLLFIVLRAAWKRIRGVVLVDPPDHESWTTLETYHMKHNTIDFSKTLLTQYFLLRGKSHIAFSVLSCLIFMGIGKLGAYVYLRTLLFTLANVAFLVGPLLKMLPTPKDQPDELVPDVGGNELWSPSDLLGGPDSLNPFVPPRIPDHDEDSEDEFHFDTKHFDSHSSSTSSTSTSFELINL